MRLYIIRHGQTDWNVLGKMQGQTDIALNENGRALAHKTGKALSAVPFGLAFTSPLKRARETANIILGEARPPRKIPLVADERLKEIGFGAMEGGKMTDDEALARFYTDPEHYVPPAGGETFQQLEERTGSFLNELEKRTEWKDDVILVSVHGAASRALLANMTSCPIRDFWQGKVPPNCAVTIADFGEGKWKIKEQDIVYYDNENIGL